MNNNKLNNRQLKQAAGGMGDWGEVRVDAADCIGCAACRDSCPTGALDWDEGVMAVNEACVGCGNCLDVCPTGAIHRI